MVLRGMKRHPYLVVTYTDAAGSGQIERPENNPDPSTDSNNED